MTSSRTPAKEEVRVGACLIQLIDGAPETHWTLLSIFHEYGQQLEKSVAEQIAMSMPTKIFDEAVGEGRAYQEIVFPQQFTVGAPP